MYETEPVGAGRKAQAACTAAPAAFFSVFPIISDDDEMCKPCQVYHRRPAHRCYFLVRQHITFTIAISISLSSCRFVSGSSRLCVVVPITLVACPAPAGSVSWCCRLLSFCVRLQQALYRGAVVYSRFVSGSSPLCVVVLSFTFLLCARLQPGLCRVPSFILVLCPAPAGSVSWCGRLLSR